MCIDDEVLGKLASELFLGWGVELLNSDVVVFTPAGEEFAVLHDNGAGWNLTCGDTESPYSDFQKAWDECLRMSLAEDVKNWFTGFPE
jgi:hypothetical protein